MRYAVASVAGSAVFAILWVAVRVVDVVEDALERVVADLSTRHL